MTVLVLPRADVVHGAPLGGDDEHGAVLDRLSDLGPAVARLVLGHLCHRPEVAPKIVEVRGLREREAQIDQDGHEPSVAEEPSWTVTTPPGIRSAPTSGGSESRSTPTRASSTSGSLGRRTMGE